MAKNYKRRASNIFFDTSADSESLKDDPDCVACNQKFDKNGGFCVLKLFCKFCLKGVCENCSQDRITYEKIGPDHWACKDCYLIYKKSQEIKDSQALYNEKLEELKMLQQKFQKTSENYEKNSKTQKIQELIAEYDREQQEYDQEIQNVKSEIQIFRSKMLENEKNLKKITKLKKENSEMQEKLKNIQNTKFLSETLQNEIRSKRLELEEILDSKQQYTKTINTMPIKHVDTYILELEMQKKTIIELEDELKAGLKHLEVHGTRKDCKCCGLL